MLYLTTRDKHEAMTAPWAMRADTAGNGGRYLPFKMPRFTPDDIAALKEKSFGQTVADMLNLFFGTKLTGWDVEFAIGRYPVKIVSLGQKVTVAEIWRNLDGSYEKLERNLCARVCGSGVGDVKMTSWLRIAVRIAVLCAVFGELQRQGVEENLDVAVSAADFGQTMALWYGRRMGLPVGTIICGCDENDNLWDLLHIGQMRTAGKPSAELERLIHGAFGVDETLRYCGVCERGEVYNLLPHMAQALRDGMFAAVVSHQRMMAAIPNVYSTSAYIMEPEVAVSYSALLDYRAKTGTNRATLILSGNNPADNIKEIGAAMKLPEEKLKELMN